MVARIFGRKDRKDEEDEKKKKKKKKAKRRKALNVALSEPTHHIVLPI